MNDRTSKILEAAVKEFIKSGRPISSLDLYKKYDFGVRPATIRAELNYLTSHYFLEQLHHSSGRQPTDLGYRFFADISAEIDFHDSLARRCRNFFEIEDMSDFIKTFSEGLKVFGVSYEKGVGAIRKEGLRFLVERLEGQPASGISKIIGELESIEERISRFGDFFSEDGPKVFIGQENPFVRNENLAVIGGRYCFGRGREVVVLAVGPKRMNYQKAIGVLKGLALKGKKTLNKINSKSNKKGQKIFIKNGRRK
jgi:transcriptional regulator of heat shock response